MRVSKEVAKQLGWMSRLCPFHEHHPDQEAITHTCKDCLWVDTEESYAEEEKEVVANIGHLAVMEERKMLVCSECGETLSICEYCGDYFDKIGREIVCGFDYGHYHRDCAIEQHDDGIREKYQDDGDKDVDNVEYSEP